MSCIMDSKGSRSARYPPQLVFEAVGEHKETFIILHGRGSTAQKFAEPLLNHLTTPTSEQDTTKTFATHISDTKLVFPTASLRRAVLYKRSLTHQWFDNWSLDRPEHRQDLQVEGLRESSEYIHSLLREAMADVGAEKVTLIGLSQGCAASLMALLLWDGPPIKAFVGMCGWLPFRKAMQSAAEPDTAQQDGDAEGDVFERDDDDAEEPLDRLRDVTGWLANELETDAVYPAGLKTTPILLAHGEDDEKVPFELGQLASSFLSELGLKVDFKSYEGLAHWYSADMLRDVVEFVQKAA